MENDGVIVVLGENGELISARHEGERSTVLTVSRSETSDWHVGTVRLTQDGVDVVVAEGRIQPITAGRTDAPASSIRLTGDGLARSIDVFADRPQGRVVIRDNGRELTGLFDFATWNADLDGTLGAAPPGIAAALTPVLPILRANRNHLIGSSDGQFAPVLGRPPFFIREDVSLAELFVLREKVLKLSPGATCHAWCWGSAGAATALCCLGTGGLLCVLCAGAEGAAASICSDSC